MTNLLDSLKGATFQDQVKARAVYAELLKRADSPNGDDVATLRELMDVLDLSNEDVAADLAAVRQVSTLLPELLSRQRLADIADEGAEAVAKAQDNQRKMLADMIPSVPDRFLNHLFQEVTRALIPVGSNAGLAHIERSAQWEKLWKAGRDGELAATNKLNADTKAKNTIHELQRKHPLAFGNPRPVPAVVQKSVEPVKEYLGHLVSCGGVAVKSC